MNKSLWIVIGAVIVVGLAVWGFSAANNKPVDNKMMGEESSEKAMMTDDAANKPTDSMMKDQPAATEKDTMMDKKDEGAMMEKSGSYKDYSVATVAAEQGAGNKVVLFFHATWCPYCKAADTAFKTNTEGIPSGVSVIKTDYDSEKDLKAKYAVTTQHTFVQIDKDGNQVAKWVSGDIAMLKTNLK